MGASYKHWRTPYYCLSHTSPRVSPAIIKIYLSTVCNLHLQSGLTSPTERSVLVSHLLHGIKCTYSTECCCRLPITPHLLTLFYQHLNITLWDHLVLWTAMLVAFFSFLHSSELLALNSTDIQLSPSQHSSSLYTYNLTICASKTNPFRHGCAIRLAPSGHHLLCPR